MSAEIERKFLLAGMPPGIARSPGRQILQGYLSVEKGGAEVRLRRQGRSHSLTVKSGSGLIREEREIALTARQYAELWPATVGRRLSKRRIRRELGSVIAEIDVYGGRLKGIVIAEVEFRSTAEAAGFRPPKWFGREVTRDPAYRSRSLAILGRPQTTLGRPPLRR